MPVHRSRLLVRLVAAIAIGAFLFSGSITPASAEPVGSLLLADRIAVRGLSAIEPERLATALADDDDLLILSRPQGNRRLLLSGVVRKATLALQHAGFAAPRVNASIEPTGEGNGERIVVDVVEGARSVAGNIEIAGLPDELAGRLHRWLQGERPPQGALARMVGAADGWDGIRWMDDTGRPTAMEEPLWKRGEPAPFDPPHLRAIRTAIAAFLRNEGHFDAAKVADERRQTGLLAGLAHLAAAAHPHPATTVDVAIHPGADGASLAISVEGLPPPAVLRDVRLPEKTRTTRDELLAALAIAPGMPVTEHDRFEWREKLRLSGRFLRAEVTFEEAPGGADGVPGIVAAFDLDDYTAASPLGSEPTREESVMLRFRQWLTDALAGGDDLVADWRPPMAPGLPAGDASATGRVVISPTAGVLVAALPDAGHSCGLAVSGDGIGCYLPEGAGRFEVPLESAGRVTVQVSLSLSRKKDGSGFERQLSLGAGFESKPRMAAAPFAVVGRIDPAACLAIVHEGKPTLRWEGEHLFVETPDATARFHGPSGRLESLRVGPDHTITLAAAPRAFDAAQAGLRAAAGEDRTRPEALLTSGIDFFTDPEMGSAFDRTFAAAGFAAVFGALEDRYGRPLDLLRKAAAAGALAPADRLLAAAMAGGDDRDPLPIPREPTPATDPIVAVGRLAAARSWRIVERTCGRDNWLAALSRLATLAAAGDAAALEELGFFLASEQAGPVACLAASSGVPMPVVSVTLARRGQEHLSPAAFHTDCVPLRTLLGAAGLDRSAVILLRTLSDDDAHFLGDRLVHDPEFLIPLVRELRAAESEAAAVAALPSALDRWWDAGLGRVVATLLADRVAPRTAANPEAPVR